MMKRVLITGSNGFIGQYLLKRLKAEKYIVTCLDRQRTPFCDITKMTDVLKNSDIIFHLAGKTKGSLQELIEGNVVSTACLMKAISMLSGEKPIVIFPSTIGVYSPSTKITEKSKVAPESDYAISKLLAENVLNTFSEKNNIPVSILRVANVYGIDIVILPDCAGHRCSSWRSRCLLAGKFYCRQGQFRADRLPHRPVVFNRSNHCWSRHPLIGRLCSGPQWIEDLCGEGAQRQPDA